MSRTIGGGDAPLRAALLSLLQFADGLFPTGGYAHSFGLETYCQAGIITDRVGLEAFVRAHLEGAAAPCDAVALAGALRATQSGDHEACAVIDATLEAMKPVREFREASRQMGRQTLRVAAALTGDSRLIVFQQAVEAGRTPGHHPVTFGMAGAVVGWSPTDATTAFLYATAALLVGAGLRLLPLGQLEGQRVLWSLRDTVVRLAAEAAATAPDDVSSFTPGLEIAGMRHASLERRLFRS
ncbi:MAG: urease accessory protein UreF [Candidatus Rokubacteria bacterium]|nr:urease accessory protein UreF [Candidatus Rokubacteria bacterium]